MITVFSIQRKNCQPKQTYVAAVVDVASVGGSVAYRSIALLYVSLMLSRGAPAVNILSSRDEVSKYIGLYGPSNGCQ